MTPWSRSHRPPSSRPRTPSTSSNLPFDDTADFDDADRGFIAALEPCVVKAADGRVVWDNDAYAFLTGDAPTTVHPSLWRQCQLCAKQGLYEVVEGIYQVRGLDLSNISFIEGDTGDHRHRPAGLHRDRRRGAGAVPRAPRRPAGRRGHLHPQPRRPLRRRARRDHPGRRRRRARWRSSRPRASPSMRCRRTSTPARRWRAAPPTCTARRWPADRRVRSAAGWVRSPSTGEVALIVPTLDIRDDRRDAHHRRRRDRVPDGAGHRGAGRDALLLPEVPRAVHGGERHPQPAQPADPARRAGARPARLGGLSDRGDRHVRRPRRRRVRLAPLADLGSATRSSNSFRCNGICTPTCTTRRCASSTRATPASRSPRASRCRPRWRRPGTPTATTVRSATTSRRSTSATWAGSTAIPAGCGRTRRRRSARATSRPWAGWTAVVEIAQQGLRRRRLPLGGNTTRPRHLHRREPRRRPRTVRRHAGAAGVRRRERRLAQLLPVRRHRTARRQLRHPDPDGVAVAAGQLTPEQMFDTSPSTSTARAHGTSTSPSTSRSSTSRPTTG